MTCGISLIDFTFIQSLELNNSKISFKGGGIMDFRFGMSGVDFEDAVEDIMPQANITASAHDGSGSKSDDDIKGHFAEICLNIKHENSILKFSGNPDGIPASGTESDSGDVHGVFNGNSGYSTEPKITDSAVYFEVQDYPIESLNPKDGSVERENLADGAEMPYHFDAGGMEDKSAASTHAELNDGTGFPFGESGEVCYISSEDNNDVKTLGEQFQNSISNKIIGADANSFNEGNIFPDLIGIASNGSMETGHTCTSCVGKKDSMIIEIIDNKANPIHPCFLSLLLYFYLLFDIKVVIQISI